ncbi:MAG: hypothetical protein J1D77_03900 [Muribaculaceae bacterium]|nr:hypothetical protein [Muribaculaceae bacterium]
MKSFKIALVASISLSLVACNKDEDIVIDNPGDNPQTPSVSLNYKVLEYTPGPGQYINEKANGSAGISSPEEACLYAEKRLANSDYVSLGAWGGYIIIKFDKSVPNTGEYDFAISSNTFDSSNEPGIVWVMQDTNGNGLADETWYELKGSFFGEEGYERNYWVRYSRPGDKEDTPWEDSNGETGFVYWMGNYHDQDFYYPNWIKEDSYTLYGSRLPSRAEQDDITGVWTNKAYEWGYADNLGSDFVEATHQNRFKISDAVTETNEAADLSSIDFVKVQTSINGSTKLLGENSTEVMGFFPL